MATCRSRLFTYLSYLASYLSYLATCLFCMPSCASSLFTCLSYLASYPSYLVTCLFCMPSCASSLFTYLFYMTNCLSCLFTPLLDGYLQYLSRLPICISVSSDCSPIPIWQTISPAGCLPVSPTYLSVSPTWIPVSLSLLSVNPSLLTDYLSFLPAYPSLLLAYMFLLPCLSVSCLFFCLSYLATCLCCELMSGWMDVSACLLTTPLTPPPLLQHEKLPNCGGKSGTPAHLFFFT